MKPVRVLLVDDHSLFRQGTAQALRLLGGIDVVGEADNGLDGVEMARSLRPDITLMDLSLPGLGGLEATRRICSEAPGVKVLVLTYREEEASLISALRAGASGYLLKSVGPEELWAHVRAAANGDTPVSGSVVMRLVSSLEQRQLLPNDSAISLTARERQLVDLVVRGQNNTEISRALFISVSTVKLHLHNLLEKLGLKNRAELIGYAARNGLT